MDSVLTKRNLMLFAAVLAAIKFGLLPLLSWQSGKVAELSLKTMKLNKISAMIENQSHAEVAAKRLKGQVREAAIRFYSDGSRTKLLIQTDIETVFERNQVVINGFSWVSDSTDSLRILRAKVFFTGAAEHMIRTFWDLARLPRWVNQIQFNQQIKRFSEQSLGTTEGSVTLEFYALPQDFMGSDGSDYSSVGTEISDPGVEQVD